ncbi:MAG: hypothetical protein H7836_07495 [Magnetococcus sp. YQC-3]
MNPLFTGLTAEASPFILRRGGNCGRRAGSSIFGEWEKENMQTCPMTCAGEWLGATSGGEGEPMAKRTGTGG